MTAPDDPTDRADADYTTARADPDLAALFAPESVALVGASADPNKLSGRPHRYLERLGASFSSVLKRDDLVAGDAAFVSQSGAFGGALFQVLRDEGEGVGTPYSTGGR